MRKLPCVIHDLEEHIQNSLHIMFNKRIVPATILHIYWDVRDIKVFSQKYYDLNSNRFNHFHTRTFYFTQDPRIDFETSKASRVPDKLALRENESWDNLYEVYI